MANHQEVYDTSIRKGNRTVLQAGTTAPDFQLRCTPSSAVRFE